MEEVDKRMNSSLTKDEYLRLKAVELAVLSLGDSESFGFYGMDRAEKILKFIKDAR